MSNLTPEQAEMLYQIQGCAEVGEGYYHDPVTDGLILALAAALTAPAPAEADELRAEVARLRGVLADITNELDVDDAGSLRWMASDALGPQPIFKSEKGEG